MGKKQKGGRRQILQLEEKKKVKKRKSKTSHYSDSDEDSKLSNDSGQSANTTNEACPLDSQVADFFKEIDALTVNEESVDTNENVLDVENGTLEKKDTTESEINNDEKSVDDSVQEAENEKNAALYCAWQRIKDDSTGYSYYWNVETNEVTWEVPEEYTAYVNSFLLSKNDDNTIQQAEEEDKEESFTALQKKKEAQFIEGSIIPISYYGGSSSSDESLSDDGSSQTSKKDKKSSEKVRKKNERSTGKKIKTSKLIGNSKETEEADFSGSIIGPQLPPDFHFPKGVPEAVDYIENAFTNDTKCIENRPISQSPSEEFVSSKSCTEVPCTDTPMKVAVTYSESIFPQGTPEPISYEHLEKELKSSDGITAVVVKNTGDRSPNSTVVPENVETSQRFIFGCRPVVEYDSFTDEEEEVVVTDKISKPDVTSIETPSVELVKDDNSEHLKENICTESSVPVTKTDATSIEQQSEDLVKSNLAVPSASVPLKESDLFKDTNVRAKRAHSDLEELSKNVDDEHLKYGIKKQKISDAEYSAKFWAGVDAHLAYEKQHGLGFKEQNKEYCENEPSCSKNSYKAVCFIKSDYILDLNNLNMSSLEKINEDLSNEENINQISSEKTVFPVSECAEKIGTESLVCDAESSYSSDTDSKNANVITPTHLSDTENKGTIAVISSHSLDTESEETSAAIHAHASDIKSEETSTAILSETTSFDFEDDIDEIDKALCEALEAKKVADKSSKSAALASPPLEKVTSESDAISKSTEEEKDTIAAVDKPLHSTDKTFDLAETLVDKLEFLYSLHSDLTSLNVLLIQLQTRFCDWQSGALKHEYFANRLQEVDQYISEYEGSLTTGDWIAKWDSSQKRYIYMHKETGVPQLQHSEDCSKEKIPISQMQSPIPASSSTSKYSNDGTDVPNVLTSVSDTQPAPNSPFQIEERREDEIQTSSSDWLCDASPPPPPPGVDSPPPPPPPSTPPPHSPPPLPLDNREAVCELPEDMDLENSNDSCSQPIISKDIAYEVNQIQYSSLSMCSSNNTENNLVADSVASVTSTLQTCDDLNEISVSIQASLTSNSSIDNTPALPLESLSSTTLKDDPNLSHLKLSTMENISTIATPVLSQSHSNFDSCQSSGSSTKSKEAKVKVTQTTSGPAPKKEKKKTKLLPVMALKKKNIPNLVEKWRKIREEQQKEDKIDHS